RHPVRHRAERCRGGAARPERRPARRRGGRPRRRHGPARRRGGRTRRRTARGRRPAERRRDAGSGCGIRRRRARRPRGGHLERRHSDRSGHRHLLRAARPVGGCARDLPRAARTQPPRARRGGRLGAGAPLAPRARRGRPGGRAGAVAAVQALLLVLLLHLVAGVAWVLLPATLGLALVAALAYTAFHQLLTVGLGRAGLVVSLLLLAVQLAAVGGIVPSQALAGPFAWLSSVSPLGWASTGLQQLVAGGETGDVVGSFFALAAFGAASLLVSRLVIRRARRASVLRMLLPAPTPAPAPAPA